MSIQSTPDVSHTDQLTVIVRYDLDIGLNQTIRKIYAVNVTQR